MTRQKLRITSEELRGVVGFMLTPVKEQEITNRSQDVINLDEAARAADALIRDGVSALAINSTFGEVAGLTWEEARAFTAAVVEATRDRVPLFAGVSQLNTRDTIARARVYRDVGATGFLAGRPMMAPLNDQNVIRHYTDLAEAFPDMAIILYENKEAFRRPISTAVFAELAKVPNIIACKYRTNPTFGTMAKNTYESDVEACGRNIKLLPMESDWLFANKVFGADACWTSYVNCGPAPVIALQNALQTQRWDLARAITKDLAWGIEGMVRNNDFALWLEDKVPFMKIRFNAAGYIKGGPVLPPYQHITPERAALAREQGRRGAELHRKYSVVAVAAE
jgi:4-(2-carboxyphenyl)-2-oxobut-3-enoate aldolase